RRDEAGRFEPLESGENAAALKQVSKIDWNKYPYALILAPGHGPEEPQVTLAPKARLVLGAIAKRYREGKAPFILVSGGYVHPNQTPYCEAIEMKKSLMQDYGVPENAIFIDPHARHTTTNMRNAARIIYRYGLPADKTSLITTTPAQIRAIYNAKFLNRCLTELRYQPAKYGKKLSVFDLEFWPLRESLQIDAADPLDP
ncbi:MAG: YdcF family protein, partial [Proteobacteria bacterium]